MTIPYIEKEGKNGLTAIVDGNHHVIRPDHPHYEELKAAVKNSDKDKFKRLYSDGSRLDYIFDETEVSIDKDRGVILYKGEKVHNVVADKIIEGVKSNDDVNPFIRFLDNLMKNPNDHSVDQLYNFLESRGMPVTRSGYFMAYKSVREDLMDHHTGKFDNSPGEIVKMDRDEVEHNPEVGCAPGLHVGSMEYARNFRHNTKIVLVKVNPKDVVSVPHHNHNKMRVCKYIVDSVYQEEEPIQGEKAWEALER